MLKGNGGREPRSVLLSDSIVRPSSRQLVMFAGVTRDFYEIHYDADYARANGFPGVVVPGSLKACWIAQVIQQWGGFQASLRELNVSYRGVDLVNDEFTITGKVSKIHLAREGARIVQLALTGRNSQRVTTFAEASVVLPEDVEVELENADLP
ncbi:MAG: hypothetical protein C7B45_01565 [Sulfobacillus acidophilus]|uniref:MaoC-like domain-containing protein n=1 Tax=Sulfobacillus acidophilus TaxID=53633 RepID=A0A2T2WNB6_9FIRM|nr:MAG: hypothetical protein C7B45_01565 [Sulfobacillus acidophilus]